MKIIIVIPILHAGIDLIRQVAEISVVRHRTYQSEVLALAKEETNK